MTSQTEMLAPEPASRAAAAEPLEPNPIVNAIAEAFSPIGKYFHTRRLLNAGKPLYEYTPAELNAAGAMGPWTFNLTESVLASLPTVLLMKVITLLWPVGPLEYPGFFLLTGLSPMSELGKRMNEYAGSMSAGLEPFMVPLLLMLLTHLCARGSLHRKDFTPERAARARWAYLYIDGVRGLVPQFVFGLAMALMAWCGYRGTLTLPVGIALGLPLLYSTVHLIYISVYLQPRLLFAINGYSTQAVHFWTPRHKRPANVAPWGRYRFTFLVSGLFLSMVVIAIMDATILGIAYVLATISVQYG
jgi:hypothetical protein